MDKQILEISEISDFVTNVGTPNSSANLAIRTRGLRHDRDGSLGYRDGGTIHRYPSYPYDVTAGDINIIGTNSIFVPSENKEYQIIVGLDSHAPYSNTRIFIDNGTPASVVWTELTEKITGTITSIAGNISVTIDSLTSILGMSLISSKAINYFKGWIAYNQNRNTYTYIISNTKPSASTNTIVTHCYADTLLKWKAGDTIVLYHSAGLTNFNYNNGNDAVHLNWLNVEEQAKTTLCYGEYLNEIITAQRPIQIKKADITKQFSSGWIEMNVGEGANILCSSFADDTTGVVGCSNGFILITYDAGATWTRFGWNLASNVNGIAIREVGGIYYVIVALQSGHIYWKATNTSSWASLYTVTTTPLNDIVFLSDTEAWAVGDNGLILHGTTMTTPDAMAFSSQVSGVTDNLMSISLTTYLANTYGYIAVEHATNNVLTTVDAGAAWTIGSVTGLGNGRAIHAYDYLTAWIISDADKGFKTEDGGANWTEMTLPANSYYRDVKFVSANVGWIVGLSDVSDGGHVAVILYTSDGGTTWTTQTVNINGVSGLSTIDIFSTTVAYIGGYGDGTSKFFKTEIAGAINSTQRWQIENPQFLPNFVSAGTQTASLSAPITTAQTYNIGEGIMFSVTIADEDVTGAGKCYYARMYVTAVYDYQESDPILKIHYKGSATDLAYNHFPSMTITPKIDMGMVNSKLTGFNFYVARKYQDDINNGGIDAGNWIEDNKEAYLVKELRFTDTGWVYSSSDQYSYSKTLTEFTYSKVADAVGGYTLYGSLGHASNEDREYRTRRFSSKASRSQNTIIACDNGDRQIRLSSYDGYDVHQDDNFAFVSADNAGLPLLVNLQGDGTIMGMAMNNQNVIILRQSEMEIVDIISGITHIVPIDCVSKNSIYQIGANDAPAGVVWAGRSGIYYLPADGTDVRLINLRWKNFYDGSMFIGGATPTSFISDTDRSNIIMGYDRTYGEVLAQIRCVKEDDIASYEYLTFRYNIAKDRWNVRQFNVTGSTGVAEFKNRRDNTLSVVNHTGILKYPNLDRTLLPHEDSVSSLGVTANRGIPTMLKISCGQIYSLRDMKAIVDFIMDFSTTVTSNTTLTVKFYINSSSAAFETKLVNLSNRSSLRQLPPIGLINNLEIEISFTDTLMKYQNFELYKISLGYVSRGRIGNS